MGIQSLYLTRISALLRVTSLAICGIVGAQRLKFRSLMYDLSGVVYCRKIILLDNILASFRSNIHRHLNIHIKKVVLIRCLIGNPN